MDPIVLMDTNVVLAHCLDPAMDAKGKLAAEVFETLDQEAIQPRISESVRKEFETKLHTRVGQIADVIRLLLKEPPPQLEPRPDGLEGMERIFSRLRAEASEAPGALQLIEGRLAKEADATTLTDAAAWRNLLSRILIETTVLLTEIQRRFDVSGLEVVRPTGALEHEKFREFVPRPDLDHIASAARIAQTSGATVVFVTLEHRLHAVRDRITEAEPTVVVTTPAYLRNQINKARS